MNNYEYIIAGLPVLQQGGTSGCVQADSLISGIREQLSSKDNSLVDLLLDGYVPERLDADFYASALSHRNRFIREFFGYDLDVRNTRVEYLNRMLGRPSGLDMVIPEGREDAEFEGRGEVLSVLSGTDILKRERGLDDLMWKKIDEITVMDVFDIEVILGFIAKLKIIDRWEKLDPATGREYFRKLVDEIRSTYDNKKNNMI